jgi:ribosomal protein S18 acetylase RimI-like enzyme
LDEALAFLSERPLHSVILAGWLRDRGVKSLAHRGDFYRCRDTAGDLIGVGLAGRHTFFEAQSYEAIRAFAEAARERTDIHMVFAEVDKFYEFWQIYSGSAEPPRLATTEMLFETSEPLITGEPVSELRLAAACDLFEVVRAHAEMVNAETGADPLVLDRDGFVERCVARIEQGRVWVWFENGKLVFKCDVVSDTPKAAYLEGIWVDPSMRGKGLGRRAIATLCATLLNGSNAVCGFVNSANSRAQSLYWKTGFNLCGRYKKIYL